MFVQFLIFPIIIGVDMSQLIMEERRVFYMALRQVINDMIQLRMDMSLLCRDMLSLEWLYYPICRRIRQVCLNMTQLGEDILRFFVDILMDVSQLREGMG